MSDEKKPDAVYCDACGRVHEPHKDMPSAEELTEILSDTIKEKLKELDIPPYPENRLLVARMIANIAVDFADEAGKDEMMRMKIIKAVMVNLSEKPTREEIAAALSNAMKKIPQA